MSATERKFSVGDGAPDKATPLAILVAAVLLAGLLAPAPARAQSPESDNTGRGWWRAMVSVGTVLNLSGWDGTEVELQDAASAQPLTRTFDGESGFASGAYAAAYAGLDRHFQLGGFLYFLGIGVSAAHSGDGDEFYRAQNVVGLGLSAKGGGRIHRVIWLGAALDVGLGIVLPRNTALSDSGGHLELDDWYGMFLFPRLHADILATGARDAGVGFFWDFGPMFLPVARGAGRSRDGATELGFSTWAACLQMVMGFSFGL
ncbi:MAG: hypothetical protein HY905_00115 [Deltaproteobacteria bacterium]|nr:hypothetical protein [Deltaproteobacteria bacterium]